MRTLLAGCTAAALFVVQVGAAQDSPDTSAAKQTYYEVEIVLFEHARGEGDRTAERWEPVVTTPDFTDVAGFERPVLHSKGMEPVPEAFVRLDTADAQLGGAVEKLRSAEAYRVIEHLYWRQPPTPPEKAVPLRFRSGDPMSLQVPETGLRQPRAHARVQREVELLQKDDEGDAGEDAAEAQQGDAAPDDAAAGTSDAAAATPAGDELGDGAEGTRSAEEESLTRSAPDTPFGSGMLAPARQEVKVYPLDGTITLVVSRYLHLYANLHFTTTVDWRKEVRASRTPAARSGEDESAFVRERVTLARNLQGNAVLSYPFEQQRRMRSGTLHYLDHPVVGMLVIVEPTELTPAEASAGPGEAGVGGD